MPLHRKPHALHDARTWSEGGGLCAILDACDAPVVLKMVLALGDERPVFLYRHTPEQNLDMVAPHLTAVDSTLFDCIVQVLWNEPRGVFVCADADMSALRVHLRKFLSVRYTEGGKWLFRYYDPRALAAYLPTCNDQELDAFFGSVSVYGVSDRDAGGVAPSGRSSYSNGLMYVQTYSVTHSC